METEAIVEQIKSLLAELRAKGISEDIIDSLIGPGADYRVVVDGRGYLLLPSFSHRTPDMSSDGSMR